MEKEESEMARALKCDRCGKLYEHYDGIKLNDKGMHYQGVSLDSNGCWSKSFDLCPECMTKLVEFIKAEKEEGDGK